MVPVDHTNDGISLQVLKCSSTEDGEGISMIRIFTDGKTEIPEGVTSTDLGDCTIERISSTHYTAMVTNRSCYICSLISKSKCFLMSSVPVDGNIVAARQGNQLVTAFHPELCDDLRVHQVFLNMIRDKN